MGSCCSNFVAESDNDGYGVLILGLEGSGKLTNLMNQHPDENDGALNCGTVEWNKHSTVMLDIGGQPNRALLGHFYSMTIAIICYR